MDKRPDFRVDRLNEEIATRVLSNEDAARLIGVPSRSLHRWRKGKNTPRQKHIRAVASAFGRDPAYFVEQDAPGEMAA